MEIPKKIREQLDKLYEKSLRYCGTFYCGEE